MPMYHDWVPKWIRPWIYVVVAFCFQFSGGVYLGSLNYMMGERAWLREDVMMMLYCNLAGMAVWFPVLFRLKFRFTNKGLLTTAAIVIIVTNLLTTLPLPVPVMWLVCFISGIAKLQGTFECVSNVQLWLTPKRDFAVFFPLLHVLLLTSIEVSGYLSTMFAEYTHWTVMHIFVIGLMFFVLLVQALLCRPFCPMPPEKRVPLKGIDWISAILWALFWLQLVWVRDYGDVLDWFNSNAIVTVTGTTCLTLAIIMVRMQSNPKAYIEWHIVRYRYFRPIIFFVVLFEIIISVEKVLENLFFEMVMHYNDVTAETLTIHSLIGIISGCLFCLLWLRVLRWGPYKLIGIGMAFICIYCMSFYFLISPNTGFYQLVPPIICRGFGYAVLSIVLMKCLNDIMSFEHFFQALSIFNFLHMFGGGAIGGAILARGIGHYTADGFARYNGYITLEKFTQHPFDLGSYMEGMVEGFLAQAVKSLYGWMIWACIIYIIIFLLWDRPAVRQRIKRMPAWSTVGAWTVNSLIRLGHLPRRHKRTIETQ